MNGGGAECFIWLHVPAIKRRKIADSSGRCITRNGYFFANYPDLLRNIKQMTPVHIAEQYIFLRG
jgi:hypothetical protein